MNAWIPRAGWRQRPYLHLGLPLFATLTPDERAAVVGHELAHERHGDTALRSALVASAATTLAEIYWLISPEEPHLIAGGPRSAQARHSAANAVAYAFMAVVAFIVRPFATAFVWLTQRRSRRAEYLADQAAAEVGGTAAARTTLVKLHAGNVHSVAAEAAAGDGDVFARLRARVAAAPGREWQRVERVMQHEDTRLDISHPPSAQRVAMLDRMPPHDGAGVLTPEQSAKIDAELALAERSAANLMIEAHRARLYR
jgi:Zn-dependent protease with chaperone function